MGLRGPKPQGETPWMRAVAELMVQEAMSFSAACMAMGVNFDNTQAERAAQYCEPFRNILYALEFKYFGDIGDNPLLTKGYLAGRLVWAIDELSRQGQPDKVSMPGKLLADLMGWLKETPDAPVFANLSQADIDKLRVELKAKQQEQEQTAQTVQVVVVDGKPPN